jgi:hypothetical protein
MTVNWSDDWFGPGLVYTWKLLMFLTGKFSSLFLFQMITYWLFIMALSWSIALYSARYWAIMLIGIIFSFIPQYIMRDSLMVIAWGIAALLMLHSDFNKHKAITIAIILLLSLYGLLLRPNAIAALLPFLLALVIAFKPKLHLLKSLGLASVLTIILFFANNLLLYKVFRVGKAYPVYKLRLLDIAGISKLSGHNYMPPCITQYPSFNYDSVMSNYTPASFDDIYWNSNNWIPSPDSALNACVQVSWKEAVIDHPTLYIKNRFEGFLYYTRIKKRYSADDYMNAFIDIDPQNPLGLTAQPNKIKDTIKDIYQKLGRIGFFEPWVWLLLNLAVFIYSLFKYRKRPEHYLKVLACIQLSGIIFLLSQITVYQHDKDFRYNYWTVFAVLISLGIFRNKRGGSVNS